MTQQLADLAHIGNVPDDYEHYRKDIIPLPDADLVLPDAHLKWYEVRKTDRVISEESRREAHEFLLAETKSGNLDISGDLGFVIHHLCGESFYFLLVCTWRRANEMWETVYTKDDGPFTLLPQGTHMEVICVWELGAVLHEQQAWTRYLYSARDERAKLAYLDERFTGSV